MNGKSPRCETCNLPSYRCCCPRIVSGPLDNDALNEALKKPMPLTFVPAPVPIVSMVAFKDTIFVATTAGVYFYNAEGKLQRIEFENEPLSTPVEHGPQVVDNRLFYKLKDGSSVVCECIADPVASEIVDLWRKR